MVKTKKPRPYIGKIVAYNGVLLSNENIERTIPWEVVSRRLIDPVETCFFGSGVIVAEMRNC